MFSISDDEDLTVSSDHHRAEVDLVDSGLRWCSASQQFNGPLAQHQSLDSLLDQFIDKHLWYLPLPRFSRAFKKSQDHKSKIIVDILEAANCARLHDYPELKPINSLEAAKDFFIKKYAFIDVFRSIRFGLDKLCLLVCLQALDAKQLNALNLDFVERSDLVEKCKNLVGLYVQGLTNELTLKEIIVNVSEHLCTPKPAVPDTKTESVKPTPDLNKPASKEPKYDTYQSMALLRKSGFSTPALELVCSEALKRVPEQMRLLCQDTIYISSLLEEEPECAYYIEKKWITF